MRLIRAVVDKALDVLSPEFDRLYARVGRPAIAPETLLRALLQAFYSIRSERRLIEQLDYNLLFRWFNGLSVDAPVWDAATFSNDCERLLDRQSPRRRITLGADRGCDVAGFVSALGRAAGDAAGGG